MPCYRQPDGGFICTASPEEGYHQMVTGEPPKELTPEGRERAAYRQGWLDAYDSQCDGMLHDRADCIKELDSARDVALEWGAEEERVRLRSRAQSHHAFNHHGPAVYSTADHFDACSVPVCKAMAVILAPEEPLRTGPLLEYVAHLEHEQWMTWAKTLMESEPGLSTSRFQRWQTLMVPYQELPEEMKEFDREWARKVLTACGTVFE